jgi:hypothetical protein
MEVSVMYHEINDEVKIDFEVPEILQDIIDQAEEADKSDNLMLYCDLSECVDVLAKNLYTDGLITKKQWDTLAMRYR